MMQRTVLFRCSSRRFVAPIVASSTRTAAATFPLSPSPSSSACVTTQQLRFARVPANPTPQQNFEANKEVVLSDQLKKDLQDMIARDRIVIFLTGTPHQPRCRFTAMLVDLLNQIGIKYSYVNILDDEEVCEGLKVYSNWPTYPQFYVDQELIGGYDIIKTMMLNGQLTEFLKKKNLL